MTVVAATLIALALSRPGQWALLAGLAVTGTGLGLFTPPNNAAIMAAAPKRQSGMAGDVLNMTRGTGTALGLALTAAAYELGGSPWQGFRIGVLFLAITAAAAAWLASRRGLTSPDPVSAPTADAATRRVASGDFELRLRTVSSWTQARQQPPD